MKPINLPPYLFNKHLINANVQYNNCIYKVGIVLPCRTPPGVHAGTGKTENYTHANLASQSTTEINQLFEFL